MGENADSNIRHARNSFGVHITRGLRSGAGNLKHLTRRLSEKGLPYLAATRVPGAKNEDEWFGGFHDVVEKGQEAQTVELFAEIPLGLVAN